MRIYLYCKDCKNTWFNHVKKDYNIKEDSCQFCKKNNLIEIDKNLKSTICFLDKHIDYIINKKLIYTVNKKEIENILENKMKKIIHSSIKRSITQIITDIEKAEIKDVPMITDKIEKEIFKEKYFR